MNIYFSKTLILLSLITFTLSSCQKENTFLRTGDENILTDIRGTGGSPHCDNLILNPGFDDTNCVPGINAFNNCVDDWECYWGSADLVSNAWHWGMIWNVPFWQDISFDSNMAFLCCGGSIGLLHAEGIYQKIDMDPDLAYQLSLSTASTEWAQFPNNGNLTLHVKFDSDLPNTCGTLGDIPDCLPDITCVEIPISEDYIYPNMLNFSTNLNPGIEADEIYIFVTTDNVGGNSMEHITGVFLDDISLTCRNELLTGIDFSLEGHCKYQFNADFSGFVDAVEFFWDFGDGNTSTAEMPSHQYTATGTYRVTLTILDTNGCCTTVETNVNCGVSECDYYLCWAGPGNSMQAFETLAGVNIIDDNGVLHQVEMYNPPLDIVGQHNTIYNDFRDLLIDPFGLNPNQIKSSDPDIDCYKGNPNNEVKGFFVNDSEVQVVSFYGYVNDNNTIPVEVPFNVKDCQ